MSAAVPAGGAGGHPAPPDWLRHAVRDVLQRSPGYGGLAPEHRRALAQAMVRVSSIAAQLIAEEHDAGQALGAARARARGPLARAQEAPAFGTATERMANTTQAVLGAVSFPRFVTDLVNGVFKAMLDSSAQQMQLYVQLLNNVSASAEGFEKSQFSLGAIRQWVADHFPESIEYDLPEAGDEPPDPEDVADITLRLKPNASMPSQEELRAVLGLAPEESVDASNPEQLVPLARRQIARQRQQMLATMVMLGMQRIVIDSGKINASMRFHIDTRSAANEDKASQFGMQNRIKAKASYGAGAIGWGASAELENNLSYVSTQRSQNTEEINSDLELNSSVELNFRTDYLPLNQMAAQAQADRVRNASLNPAAAAPDPSVERTARQKDQRAAEENRRSGLLTMPAMPAMPAPSPPATQDSGAAARPATGAGSGTAASAGQGGAGAAGSGTPNVPGTTASTGPATGASAGAQTGASAGAGATSGAGAAHNSSTTPHASTARR